LNVIKLERFLICQEELFSLDSKIIDIDKRIEELNLQKQNLINSKPELEAEVKELSMNLFSNDIIISNNEQSKQIIETSITEVIENKPKEEDKKEFKSLTIPENFKKTEFKVEYKKNHNDEKRELLTKLRN
jgi:hypothetical protein